MKFCKPIKPLELFTDDELTDAWQCGGQHQFAIVIWERWQQQKADNARLAAELVRVREAINESVRAIVSDATFSLGNERDTPEYVRRVYELLHATLAAKEADDE